MSIMKHIIRVSCLSLALLVGVYSTVSSGPDVGGKIIGGVEVEIEEYPWQVSVEVNRSHICGGSIITEYWSLSAAHCAVDTLSLYRIRVGSSTIGSGGVTHLVELKVAHGRYDAFTFDYDYALFKVASPFAFQDNVGPIALARQDQEPEEGNTGVATGWGATENLTISLKLKMVRLPIYSKNLCESSYSDQQAITDRMFCAGRPQGGISACTGDSGGPLIVDNLLVGVVSWGGEICGKPGDPTIFAKVSSVRTWIDNQIGQSAAATHVSSLLVLCALTTLHFIYTSS